MRSDRRPACVVPLTVGLTALACLGLSGCGAQPTGHGAPPYQDDVPTRGVAKIRTHYPALSLRFSLPAMAGSDYGPVRAYVAFAVASTRSVRSGTTDAAVRRNSTTGLSKIVAKEVATERALGYRPAGPTQVDIRDVRTVTNARLTVCVHDQNRVRDSSSGAVRTGTPTSQSFGVLVAQRKSGRWYVAALQRTKNPLRRC